MQSQTRLSPFVEKSFSDIIPIYDLREGIQVGRYDSADSWLIPENIQLISRQPHPPNSADFSVLCFDKDLVKPDVLGAIKKENHSPVNAGELLGYLAFHPEVQALSPIIAPGEIFFDRYGNEAFLCFSFTDGKRRLFLACTQNAKGKDRIFDKRFRYLGKPIV